MNIINKQQKIDTQEQGIIKQLLLITGFTKLEEVEGGEAVVVCCVEMLDVEVGFVMTAVAVAGSVVVALVFATPVVVTPVSSPDVIAPDVKDPVVEDEVPTKKG